MMAISFLQLRIPPELKERIGADADERGQSLNERATAILNAHYLHVDFMARAAADLADQVLP